MYVLGGWEGKEGREERERSEMQKVQWQAARARASSEAANKCRRLYRHICQKQMACLPRHSMPSPPPRYSRHFLHHQPLSHHTTTTRHVPYPPNLHHSVLCLPYFIRFSSCLSCPMPVLFHVVLLSCSCFVLFCLGMPHMFFLPSACPCHVLV